MKAIEMMNLQKLNAGLVGTVMVFLGMVGMALPALAGTGNVTSEATVSAVLQAFGFAFLGGVILNLMPCVFPVLSMKALALCKMSDQEERVVRWHGLEYSAGVIISFVVIAGVLMALRAAGAQVGWGFHLQNPMMVLFLTYVLFAIGLNFSGFFDVKAAFTSLGNDLTRPDKVGGSFFTGVLATFVAAPCTAPFMGAAMGFALTQPVIIGLGVFVVLGLGLAFPYLLLSFVPVVRHILPRPGPWMETFRQFLAFPMYGSAIWLVWVLGQQWGLPGVVKALAGLLTLTFAIWLIKHAERAARGVRLMLWVVAVASVVAAFFSGCAACKAKPMATVKDMMAAFTAENQPVDSHVVPFGDPQAFSPALLEEALAGDGPVLVNMTAAWCITCKANERVALSKSDVKALMADKHVLYLKGDWTNQDPDITAYLADFGRQGVPLYVYYGPRAAESAMRPEPHILPQILTPALLHDVFQ